MKGRNEMSVDTQDMEIVHRAFRRESRLLMELVAAVAPGDTARAKVIADHFRDYRLGLKNHHEGEDELLWPPWEAAAGAEERDTLLSALPALVRGIWHIIGRPRYARHISRVRAA
ncbi:hemerythrin domain-containing protein [Nonomuraea sp. JJY05]|uniref:hemerythrin domain-containing protein n=1 Tax=Nonomuraea sp. JJY05 TaxID=3350255 RepID=UPI00373ED536